MNKVDCFIPCCLKDNLKLELSIKSVAENFQELGDVVVSMPDKGDLKDYEIDGHKVKFFNDFEVLPIPNAFSMIRFRKGWIFQQLLKLLQQNTTTPDVLVWDADCFMTKPFSAYADGKLKLLSQPNEKDDAGFERWLARCTGGELGTWTRERYCKTKYIADKSLFRRQWIWEAVLRYFPDVNEFVKFTIDTAFWTRDHQDCSILISEYEWYGRFVERFHSDDVVVSMHTRRQIDKFQMWQEGNEGLWEKEELEKLIEETKKDSSYDCLKLQTNCPTTTKKYAGYDGIITV